ncbi:MAG TPA: transcription antitermination factor NusB [Candidatus Acidoferrales bacterium]|nr:transcription antitermination factor NusB [Candidatus Acidoferrales bacterium]
MASRRKARECALQLLYQWEGDRPEPTSLLAAFWKGRDEPAATRQFAEQLFLGAVAALDEIDPLIAARSEHWKLERMAAIDRSLLRLAVYEMRSRADVSPAVVINEALEIARRFSSADSVEFINGVLDAIRKAADPAHERQD